MPPTIADARDANRKMKLYKEGNEEFDRAYSGAYEQSYWAPGNPHIGAPREFESFESKKVTHIKLPHQAVRELYRGIDYQTFMSKIRPGVEYDLQVESFKPHDVRGWIYDEVDTRDSGFFAAGSGPTVNLRRMAVSISAMRAIKDRKSQRLEEFVERNSHRLPPEIVQNVHTIFHTTTGESMTMIYRNPFQRYPTGLVDRYGNP
jgi:hypothetical protein